MIMMQICKEQQDWGFKEISGHQDKMITLLLGDFIAMSGECYSRRAQIPIRKSRFIYLTEQYRQAEDGVRWTMVHRPGHFLIIDRESLQCIVDAFYIVSKEIEMRPDDEIVAVIHEMRLRKDEELYGRGKDGFGLLADLITEKL